MKVTIKISVFLLIFASFSCSLNTENENILPQDTANTTGNLLKSAQSNSIVNTIAIRKLVGEIGKQPLFMVSFGSENIAERKGWDGTVKGKGNNRHTPFHNKRNFVLDQSGTILIELTPEDVAPGNPAFKPGTPIGGIIVKGGKNPGGQMREIKTDEKGEIELPDEWIDGEYLIQIGEWKTQESEFILKIGNGEIKEIYARNMLVNKSGTIRNFYYQDDFQLHSDIAKYLGVDKIIIAKGYYPVDYSDKENGGSVSLRVKNGGKVNGTIIINNGNLRLFEGTNPKGIDCKGFGTACFYIAERGIDKADIRYYLVKPILEKDILIGVKISEGKKGLNAVNVKKAITQSGIK